MALKTRMIKGLKDSLKTKLGRGRRCEYCQCEFSSNAEYLFHTSTHPNQIIPNLFLANKSNANDRQLLQRIGITHLLHINYSHPANTRSKSVPCHGLLECNADYVKTIEMYSDRNIYQHFHESFVFIDSALNDEHDYKILVFCEFGIALSAAFIIAYLMSRYHVSLTTAHNLLTAERNIRNISKYLKQLQVYENQYCYHAVINNHHKKWSNKINALSHNSVKRHHSMPVTQEKEAVINKRSITMKSSVYEEEPLCDDAKPDNNNKMSLFQRKKKKAPITRSHSTGYLALNSHIVFTNI